MPHLVLAGLPTPLAQRLKGELKRGEGLRVGWTQQVIPSKDTSRSYITPPQVQDVMQAASSTADSHIIGVSIESGNARAQVASSIRQYFRFRWLNNVLLSDLTSRASRFVTNLNAVLEEEEFWAANIKPAGLNAALILPEGCFRVKAAHEDLWTLSEAYGDVRHAIAFAQRLEAFREVYHKRSEGENGKFVHWWTDENDLAFRHRGGKHGSAPFPRNWKYSLELTDGFHYDINQVNHRPFHIKDINGAAHQRSMGEHVNLDPHGHVR